MKQANLSELPDNLIDFVGSFLTTNERISLGHLNHKLLAQTKKDSFLLQSNNEERLTVDPYDTWSFERITTCYPTSMTLHHTIFHANVCAFAKSKVFKNQFRRLHTIDCRNLEWMSYVPIGNFFDMTKRAPNQTNNKIQNFMLDFAGPCSQYQGECMQEQLYNFVKNYQQYWRSRSKHNLVEIDTITVSISPLFMSHIPIPLTRIDVKPILMALSPNFKHLKIDGWCKLQINSYDELKTIFHSNLKSLYISTDAYISINGINNPITRKQCLEIASLKAFDVSSTNVFGSSHLFVHLMKQIRDCGLKNMLTNVNIHGNCSTNHTLLNAVIDGHPKCNYKDVTFTISTDSELLQLRQYFDYLYNEKEMIMNNCKSIKFDISTYMCCGRARTLEEWFYLCTVDHLPFDNPELFDPNINTITIDSFDIFRRFSWEELFVNVIDWLRKKNNLQTCNNTNPHHVCTREICGIVHLSETCFNQK